MKVFCPSCGNAIEFRYDDSFVRVCDACHSALLRSDRGVESLGQFSDLLPAGSGLELRDHGRWQGQSFELVGRAEYRHPAGGSWEEWYLRFDDGRWGWLSYAQGRSALTFPSALGSELPAFEELPPGARVALGGAEFTVAERNQAELASAAGEIPFPFSPGELVRFADLSDGQGRFATLDYGQPGASGAPQLYVGRALSLPELGLRERAPAEAPAAGSVGERLACPNCAGSIELRLPGSSQSVVCPYCASVLDCTGPLLILSRLQQSSERRPPIALGAQGLFGGTRYTVTGRLRRGVMYEGTRIEWDEYLLHAPGAGYRWLVCSNGHYSFVSEVSPAAVSTPSADVARHDGRAFRLFDRGEATVSEAYGEFYWRVSAGEAVQTRDYVAPPLLLSRELSEGELHWSLGVYQSVAQVRAAFGLPAAPDPRLPDQRRGVAPHQPFLHRHWLYVGVALGVALFLVSLGLGLRGGERAVYSERIALGSDEMPAAQEVNASGQTSYVHFTPGFELTAGQNAQIIVELPLANSWAYAAVDLIHEASGELTTFGAELSRYSGVEQGEAWSEGSYRAQHLSSVQRSGTYLLRLEVQTPTPLRSWLSLQVHQGVFVWAPFLFALLALGVPSALFGLVHYFFEAERWRDSDHAPAPWRLAAGEDEDD